MKNLTPKQREVLEFISNTVAERSYPPSVREICAGVGIRSTATVHSYLKELAEMGYLTKDDRVRALMDAEEVNWYPVEIYVKAPWE